MNIKKVICICLLTALCFNSANAYRSRKGKKIDSTENSKLTSRIQKTKYTRPFSFMANLKQSFIGSSDRLRPSRSQKMARIELKKSQQS